VVSFALALAVTLEDRLQSRDRKSLMPIVLGLMMAVMSLRFVSTITSLRGTMLNLSQCHHRFILLSVIDNSLRMEIFGKKPNLQLAI
jgi:hypothetical protein